MPGMLPMINFKKAFLSISFKFVIKTLIMFAFGENFIKWITIILGIKDRTNFASVTLVNGNISTPFNLV